MTTIDITTNTASFELNGITYKMNLETNRYSKTVDGKTTRIGKAEYEAAHEEHDAREMEAYIAEAEENAKTEAGEEIAKEMAPKAKKTKKSSRKSKDIAYTYYNSDDENAKALFTLTAKQVDFIRHLPDTCFWEHGLESTPWIDVLCDEIGGQFAGKPMTVGAMVSTLCEKGIAYREKAKVNNRTCTYMGLTEIGQAVAIDLGLK